MEYTWCHRKSQHRSCTTFTLQFGFIPEELMLHIFSLLGTASLVQARFVSKRWYRLASDLTLWRLVDLSEFAGCFTDKAALQLFSRISTSLLSLNLEMCDKLTDSALSVLVNHCTNLKMLNLNYCDLLTDFGFAQLSELRNMVSLSLVCTNVTDAGLQSLLHVRHIALRQLDLKSCYGITDCSLDLLTQSATCLTALGLSGCMNLSKDCIKRFCAMSTDLQELDLEACTVQDDVALLLSLRCTGLQRLCLSVCDVTDRGVRAISSRCTRLRELKICNCSRLTKPMVSKLSKSLPGCVITSNL